MTDATSSYLNRPLRTLAEVMSIITESTAASKYASDRAEIVLSTLENGRPETRLEYLKHVLALAHTEGELNGLREAQKKIRA